MTLTSISHAEVTMEEKSKKKKKKKLEEKEPEKKKEPFKVQLKKVKKKPVHQAKEEEERVSVEEVTEFIPEPQELVQFTDTDQPDMADASSQGLSWA